MVSYFYLIKIKGENMIKTKKTVIYLVALCLILAISISFAISMPIKAGAISLPFTLSKPTNVTMTKADGDSPTTMGYSYSMSNNINAFFTAYDEAEDKGVFLQSRGITAYDEIFLGVQIDWALDDKNDAISGWHHNSYWDNEGPDGNLGTNEEFKQCYSEWDVVNLDIDATKTVNEHWLYRGMNEYLWNGNENYVGVKEQLNPNQYSVNDRDGDITITIDWTKHTIYSKVRFVVTTYNNENNERKYYFSDWSDETCYGKDAVKIEPVKKEDIPAPVITGLRMTDEQFNDNPVVAFTLTVPDVVAQKSAQVAAVNGTFRVEVDARVKGTTEWKSLNLAGEVKTGELKAALIYLAKPGETISKGTEIELRAYYYCYQPDVEDFNSNYSKVIGFGTDDISVIPDTPGQSGQSETDNPQTEETNKGKCKICHFCPQPLGLCIFIWIAIIVAVVAVIVVAVIFIKKKKNNSKK